MKPLADDDTPETWDSGVCEALIDELWSLRQSMVSHAARLEGASLCVDPAHKASAINLAHYLAMRRVDLRALQEQLARLGVSSLGRAETHVLANLDKVLGILHRLAGRPWRSLTQDEPVGSRRGPALLERNAAALLGKAPPDRDVARWPRLRPRSAADATTAGTSGPAPCSPARGRRPQPGSCPDAS